jgi:hypothetical protein
MKVLNLALDDYANFSHTNAAALRSVGVQCKDLKIMRHPFQYETQSERATVAEMQRQIKGADVIQIMHTWPDALEMCKNLKKKRVVVYHTGTTYRTAPEKWNDVFNPYVSMCFTDQCEFIGLGAKNEMYIATAVDVKNTPVPVRPVKKPLEFAHFPSNPEVKGTKEIINMMQRLVLETYFIFNVSGAKVSHPGQIERMGKCDVYIELFKPTLNGKPYGCFGVSAFEAAALGRIVVTQNIHEAAYAKVYGNCPLRITNTEQEFIDCIERLLGTPNQVLEEIQKETRAWMERNHSFEATGKRLKSILSSL